MRLLRHLTFSNVIAVIALFIALGGAAYAGSKLNGKNIVNGSIGGGKLKSETITADKIKKGTITGAQIEANSISSSAINLTTLGTVPSAQTATTAQTASTATTAQSATNAQTAKTAETATKAGEATTATTADDAKHAEEADDAKHAAEADAVGGKTAADLTLSCAIGTEFYGGMCWDETTRPIVGWVEAVSECGDNGGRLPSIGELVAYVRQPGPQIVGRVWSSDVVALSGTEEEVLTSSETTRESSKSGVFGFRCVFPRSNG